MGIPEEENRENIQIKSQEFPKAMEKNTSSELKKSHLYVNDFFHNKE